MLDACRPPVVADALSAPGGIYVSTCGWTVPWLVSPLGLCCHICCLSGGPSAQGRCHQKVMEDKRRWVNASASLFYKGWSSKGDAYEKAHQGCLCSGEQHISQQEWDCESRRGRPLLEGRQRKKSAFSENTSGETATPDKAPPALSFLSLSSLGCEVISSVQSFPIPGMALPGIFCSQNPLVCRDTALSMAREGRDPQEVALIGCR